MGVVDKPPVYSATCAFGGQQGTMRKQPTIALAGPTQLALQTTASASGVRMAL